MGDAEKSPIRKRVLTPLRKLVSRGVGDETARDALDRVRVTMSLLSLTKADLSAAEKIADEGEAMFRQGAFDEALALATRAETLAAALEEDFRLAAHATSQLREVVAKLEAAGLPADEEKAALLEIRTRADRVREVEGARVPDYAASRDHAKEALSNAVLRWEAYDKADRAVFQAELAIDASKDSLASSPSLEGAERRMKKAHEAMAAGAYEAAADEAAAAEATIDRALRAHDDTGAELSSVERTITQMRAIGIPTASVEAELEKGRELLNAGRFADARDAFAGATKAAIVGAQLYRDALEAQTEALASIRRLGEEELNSADAEKAIASAKEAIRNGNLQAAIESSRAATRAAARVMETRQEVANMINETKSRMEALRESGSPAVNDVEEILVRAENEFADGDFGASREDLRIAGILMQSEMPREGSTGEHAAQPGEDDSPKPNGAQ